MSVDRNSAPVHPSAEIGGHGDVGRGGYDPSRKFALGSGDIVQDSAETFLGGHAAAAGWGMNRRHRHTRGFVPAGCAASEWSSINELAQLRFRDLEAAEWVPFRSIRNAQ